MEQQRHFIRRNARPRVFDLKPEQAGGGIVRFGEADAQRDAAGLREFDGIVEQINQHLPQLARVNADRARQGGGAFKRKAQMLLRGFLAEHRFKIAQQREQVNRAFVQAQPPGFDFRDIQHVIDERQQVFAAMPDNRQMLLIFGGMRRITRHNLREAEYHVERRAEFVAHIGEKFALRPVRRFRRLFRVAERLFAPLERRDVAGNAEHADHLAALVAQGHFGNQRPFFLPVNPFALLFHAKHGRFGLHDFDFLRVPPPRLVFGEKIKDGLANRVGGTR